MSFYIFLVSTILVTSRQFIGEHIKCISDGGVPTHVIETFCFFTTTFTVPQHYNATLLNSGNLPHPGVGPIGTTVNEEEIKRHAYYQWVPFVLFAQAIMFYLPHLFWKSIEGGKIKRLAEGLHHGIVSEGSSVDYGDYHIMSKAERESRFQTIKSFIQNKQILSLALLYRYVSLLLHGRSKLFNDLVFSLWKPARLSPWMYFTVTKHLNYTEWLFLNYLSHNMDFLSFKELFMILSGDKDATKGETGYEKGQTLPLQPYEKDVLLEKNEKGD
ncbi:innexin [Holotrichia oblita]|uniref:Innexin n=1 Tax=Holotrichia oblita TaxID=644536 RepID=A0ACB9SZE0_HOLOL|nr:innexin [Holotrichia oblita]